MLAIPWYFSRQLNRETEFALLYAVITVLSIFWTLYAGTLIDRFPRKRVFIGINIAGGIVLCGTAAAGFAGGGLHPMAAILVFATTIFIYNIHYPSLYAFGQEITELENYARMNSKLEIQGQATVMLAGAVGAVLINGTEGNQLNFAGIDMTLPFSVKPWPLEDIFLMDGISYLLAIFITSFIRYTPAVKNEIHTGSVGERLRMGFDYLRQNRLLLLFGNMSYMIFVFLIVEAHLLQAWYVNNHLHEGAGVYASLEIFYTSGALLSGFFIRRLVKKHSKVMAIIVMMLITSLGLMLTGLTRSVAIFFAFNMLIGITNAGTRILRTTYLFEHVPNNMMGRVNSVFNVINIGLRLILTLLFSIPFFAGENVALSFVAGAVLIGISAVPLLLRRRKME